MLCICFNEANTIGTIRQKRILSIFDGFDINFTNTKKLTNVFDGLPQPDTGLFQELSDIGVTAELVVLCFHHNIIRGIIPGQRPEAQAPAGILIQMIFLSLFDRQLRTPTLRSSNKNIRNPHQKRLFLKFYTVIYCESLKTRSQ